MLLTTGYGWDHTLTQMGWFFTKAAALLTFGGAYAVLPYIYQGVVELRLAHTGADDRWSGTWRSYTRAVDHGRGFRCIHWWICASIVWTGYAVSGGNGSCSTGGMVYIFAVFYFYSCWQPVGEVYAW